MKKRSITHSQGTCIPAAETEERFTTGENQVLSAQSIVCPPSWDRRPATCQALEHASNTVPALQSGIFQQEEGS